MKLKIGEHKAFPSVFWIFFYLFVVFTIIMLDRGMTAIRTAGFMLFVGVGFSLPIEELLIFTTALEPVSILFKLNGGYTAMPFLFLAMFFKLFVRKRGLSSRKILPLFFLLAVSGINYIFRGFSVASYASFFLGLLCVVWISDSNTINVKGVFEKVVWLYVMSTLIECVFPNIFPRVVRMVTTVGEYNTRSVGFSSEWDYGRHIVVSIAFLVYWIRIKRTRVIRAIALVVYLLYCLVATGLYTGLVALAILAVVVFFSFEGTVKQKLIYACFSLVLCVIVLAVAYYFVYLPMFAVRGQISDNGRFELWKIYYNDFVSSPCIMYFGIGAGSIQDYAASLSRLTTHNTIIEKMMELGFFGMFALVYLLSQCFSKHGFRVSKNYRLLPLITFLGTCLTQGVSGSELISLVMMLSL